MGAAPSPRRAELDGLRGVAIVLTLLLHYVVRGGFYAVPVPVWLANLLDSFWSGVDVFFVLSGYLIGGILIDHRRAGNFFRVFYRRRALRILPAAFLAILFAYGAMPLAGAAAPAGGQVPWYAYLLFINNFWTAGGVAPYAPLSPMWSLAIEEQFYLLAPALVLLLSHRRWAALLVLVIAASPWLRLYSPWMSAWDFTPYRLDGLSAGMLVALLTRDARFLAYAAGNRWKFGALAAGAVLAALLFSTRANLSTLERVAFGVSLHSLAAAAVILHLTLYRGSALSLALSAGWLVTLGRWSYFLYLMHMPALLCVNAAGTPQALVPPAAFVLCAIAAWASWRWFEQPLIGLGRKVDYRADG